MMSTETIPLIEINARRVSRWPRAHLSANERRLLLIFLDLLLINGTLLLALVLWNGLTPDLASLFTLRKWWLTLSLLWFGMAHTLDLYDLARAASVTSIASTTAVCSALTALVYILTPWFTPPIEARSYMFGFVVLAVLCLTSWRIFYARWLASSGFYHRVLIVGTGDTARRLADELDVASHSRRPNPYRGTGYKVVGLVASPGERADDPRVLGEVGSLVRLARELDVQDVIVTLDGQCAIVPDVYEALLDCRELGIQVSSTQSISERLTARLPVEYAKRDMAALLNLRDKPMVRLYLVVKRCFDLGFSLIGLGVLALLAPVVALINHLTSPGPLFYLQERIGERGRPFRVVKFRSMSVNAEAATGAVWSPDRDSRITPIGRLLRKTRLDELPQVINVLRGEMSVVGPRPERPHFVGQLSAEIPVYRARHAVRPGITGWAQIHYGYGNSIEDSRIKLEYDLYYVRHFGPYIDLLTLLRTVIVMVQLKGR